MRKKFQENAYDSNRRQLTPAAQIESDEDVFTIQEERITSHADNVTGKRN